MRNHLLDSSRALIPSALGLLGLLSASNPAIADAGAASALSFAGSSPAAKAAGATGQQLKPPEPAPAHGGALGGALGGAPAGEPAGAPAAQPVLRWSEAEEVSARARCGQLLANVPAQYSYLPQTRDGACGSAAPIEVTSLGPVAISPPVVVNCELAVALHRWLKDQVQPLARTRLGTTILQINTMSSYSCRTRYGAKQAPLSQHAFANAVDIRSLVTARAELIDVELHWGPTGLEEATHAAAKAHAYRSLQAQPATAAAVATALPAAAATTATATSTGTAPATAIPASHAVVMGVGLKPSFPVLPKPATQTPIRMIASGKPALPGAPSVQPGEPLDARAQFLRQAHGAGCRIFGTVLGPEANSWHRNHLHVDLAPRKLNPYCQ